MSRRLSKLIIFAGVDEELEHIISGTHHVDSWRPLHFQVYLVVVEGEGEGEGDEQIQENEP